MTSPMPMASLSPVTKRDTAALPSPTSIFKSVTALFTRKRYVSKVRCEGNAISAQMGKVLGSMLGRVFNINDNKTKVYELGYRSGENTGCAMHLYTKFPSKHIDILILRLKEYCCKVLNSCNISFQVCCVNFTRTNYSFHILKNAL